MVETGDDTSVDELTSAIRALDIQRDQLFQCLVRAIERERGQENPRQTARARGPAPHRRGESVDNFAVGDLVEITSEIR